MTSLRFAVIGAGRLGASLALALRATGPRLVGYTALTPAGVARAQVWLGGTASATLEDLVQQRPDLYFLTVPDSALSDVASTLASLLQPTTSCIVAHTSGATSVTVLEALALVGATTLKFHPLQTFADPLLGSTRFSDAAIAVTPGHADQDPSPLQVGFALAGLLQAKPFHLPDKDSVLYHAAATFACNYLVTLEHVARRLFIKAGFPSDEALSMFQPLVDSTLDNIRTAGTAEALTGPLSRGDVDTVTQHLAALDRDAPDLLPLYRQLGLATLAVVKARGTVDEDAVNHLIRLLKDSSGNHINTSE